MSLCELTKEGGGTMDFIWQLPQTDPYKLQLASKSEFMGHAVLKFNNNNNFGGYIEIKLDRESAKKFEVGKFYYLNFAEVE